MMDMELISVTMNVSTVLFQAQNASFSFNAIVVIVHNLYRMNVWNIKSHIKDMDSCMEVSYFAFRLTCVTSLIWRTSFDVAMAYHEIQLIQTLFHWGNDPTNMAFSLPDNGKMKYCTFGPIFAALSWVFFWHKRIGYIIWWRHISTLTNKYVFRCMANIVINVVFTSFFIDVPELYFLNLVLHWNKQN
mgnify:CR=1 FL=1